MSNPYKRREAQRAIREKILIVCEGEKTEPNYFKAFPINSESLEVEICGIGMNTDSLVEYAIEKKETAERENKPYNMVWCVFDRDSFEKQNFNRAFQIAKNKVKIAYSNEAFEIWYILHFNYQQAASSRNDYEKKLTELLGKKYQKNDEKMYEELKDKQSDAIDHAKKLLANYEPNHKPESDNPCTTVHLLIEFLNERSVTKEER